MVELLAQLQVHPVLCYLTLDGSTTFVRLIAHLKRNILQPQPINERGEEVDIGWEGGGIMEGVR